MDSDKSKIYSNMMADQGSKDRVLSAIKDLVNASETVECIKFQLTGKKTVKRNINGKLILDLIKYHEPLINDLGANKLLADFESYVNPNVVLSYFERHEINRRSRVYYTNIGFELARNMLKYKIYSRENHAKIRSIMHTNFHAAIARAYNGMTLLNALKNITVSEVRDLNENKGGPLRIFNKNG